MKSATTREWLKAVAQSAQDTGWNLCCIVSVHTFVHPVIRQLPQEHHLQVEQGLLKTFGRVMPVLMTLCVILSVCYATSLSSLEGAARIVGWASAASFIAAVVSTIIFNVPINLATGRWAVHNPPENWKETRNRWEFFQGLRSWLLLIGFVLLCLASTL